MKLYGLTGARNVHTGRSYRAPGARWLHFAREMLVSSVSLAEPTVRHTARLYLQAEEFYLSVQRPFQFEVLQQSEQMVPDISLNHRAATDISLDHRPATDISLDHRPAIDINLDHRAATDISLDHRAATDISLDHRPAFPQRARSGFLKV